MAGDPKFSLRIRGENFRSGLQVELNGRAVPADKIRHVSRTLLKLIVPTGFFQDAGKLAVIVRNPEPGASAA